MWRTSTEGSPAKLTCDCGVVWSSLCGTYLSDPTRLLVEVPRELDVVAFHSLISTEEQERSVALLSWIRPRTRVGGPDSSQLQKDLFAHDLRQPTTDFVKESC